MNFFSPDSFWFWLFPSLFLAATFYGFIFFRTYEKRKSPQNRSNKNRIRDKKGGVFEDSFPIRGGSVFFGAGSSEIESEFFKSLDLLGESLKDRTDWKLRIEGWTDRHGRPATNRRLSLERAKRIQSYLCRKWEVSSVLIQISGMGVDPRSIEAEKARRADWTLFV
ncbi:OmpA family protein [Leptospira adleri]|uniref:OmpA family protein n=1 Tax=Leptospira adleri TaxID=2023186 RepID=UPI001083B558|nr:OmpA family protein [Leptospira adleri]TGM52915.1 OmpA family protein [Leptospira adleri]